MLNRVTLAGNLGRDPELVHTPGGRAVMNLPLATHEAWTDKEGQRKQQTEWHHVVVWGKRAERVAERLRKGSLVYVSGRLRTRTWKDRDNRERTTTEIQADQVVFLGTPAPREATAADEPHPGEEIRNGEEAPDGVPF